ncbi:alpha/beta hydrolase [Pseudomonas sp. LS1212]|uniref:alpha/beta hydrolase n=1 Tax=Pseudomonas sp. LS1212 TaxID=2972478 RepID=UPI00215CFB74|nr:alpha/beta hydrolase [Pseudomonas sp. LS1212]UVJ46499.1 alpha/beta hydrolase [Pseudomonas sp. LS1212]
MDFDAGAALLVAGAQDHPATGRGELDGIAPAYVALAGFDPLLNEGRAYAQRLQAHGVGLHVAYTKAWCMTFCACRW